MPYPPPMLARWIGASPQVFPAVAPMPSCIGLACPPRWITASLIQRFESRNLGEFTAKVLSAMRSEFNGHAEQKGSAGGTAVPVRLFHLPGRHFAFTFGAADSHRTVTVQTPISIRYRDK